MLCQICKKDFKSIQSLTTHIRIHKITSKEYYDKYLKKDGEGTCSYCGKPTKFYYLSRGYNKYCSASCGTVASKNKIKETCLNRYGVENPNQCKEILEKTKQTHLRKRGKISNFQCENTKLKIKETCLNRYGVENPNQCKEIQEKSKNTCLKRYGVNSFSKTEKFKQISRETRSRILLQSFRKPFSGFDELKFLKLIKENYPSLEIEDQKPCCGYFIDFYLPKFNIAIEFDEEYHQLSYMIEKDHRKESTIIKKLKCKFYRIKQQDFLNNPDLCLKQFDTFIN